MASASGGTTASPVDAAGDGAGSLLISSFSSLPGLKYGTFFGGTSPLSPVFGLRPLRGSRRRRRKLPNPRSSIFSPRCRASMMLLNTVSTMTSECFFVRSETLETSSTSSAFVMLPPVFIEAPSVAAIRQFPVPGFQLPVPSDACWKLATGGWVLSLLVLEVIAQRHFGASSRFRVRLPVRAELVVLQCADAQPDLPLRGNQLDDLHLVALANLKIQLLVLPLVMRIIELRHVDQPFDPLGQFDERAEVGHADHLAVDGVADVVMGEELVPDVGLQLLETEREALILRVDVQ